MRECSISTLSFQLKTIHCSTLCAKNSENTALLANPSSFQRFSSGSSEIDGNCIDFNIKIRVKAISDRIQTHLISCKVLDSCPILEI